MSDYHPLVTGELPLDYSAEQVLNAVCENLLKDANLLVEEDLSAIAASRRAGGWPFTQQDYDVLRKPLLANIVRLFADRLVNGLIDEDDEQPAPEGDGDE